MLSVLIVDDDKTTAATLKDVLLQSGFRVIKTTSFEEARDIIDEEHFDVAFIDVILEQGETRGRRKLDRPLGLRVCEMVRKKFRHCWIVTYSRLVDEDKNFDKDRFFRAGADDIRGSNWVSWLSVAEAHSYVEEAVHKKDREADAERPIVPKDEWRTNAAAELLSHATLRKIVRSAIPDGDRDLVTAISGGYSSSVVLSVETIRNAAGQAPLNTIIKIDRAAHPLDLEVQGAPETGNPLEFVSIRASRASEAPIDGWFYISSSALTDAATLRTIITDHASETPRLRKVTSAVITDILTPLLAHSFPVSDEQIVRPDLRLSYRFAVEIDDILSELERCKPYVEESSGKSVSVVRRFLNIGTKEGWSLSTHSPYFGYAHGDLHLGNILVAKNDNVFLIDFARSKRMPRLFDVSSLLVDLWLRVLDYSEAAEWQWERIPEWINQISVYPPFNSTRPFSPVAEADNLPAWGCLASGISEYLLRVVPEVGTNELAQSVLFQLLRFLRFSSLSMPKRLLAVHLAARLLGDLRVIARV